MRFTYTLCYHMIFLSFQCHDGCHYWNRTCLPFQSIWCSHSFLHEVLFVTLAHTEELEDTKEIIGRRKSMDRQYNFQKKTKDRTTRTPLKSGSELMEETGYF
jgi:hypothetical protein